MGYNQGFETDYFENKESNKYNVNINVSICKKYKVHISSNGNVKKSFAHFLHRKKTIYMSHIFHLGLSLNTSYSQQCTYWTENQKQ